VAYDMEKRQLSRCRTCGGHPCRCRADEFRDKSLDQEGGDDGAD